MKVLLHICCGPCAIYTVERLREKGDTPEGFFYNPNIHPAGEYIKRKEAAEKVSESLGLKINFFRDLQFEDYFKVIKSGEDKERCILCWSLRLDKAAEFASEKGFEGFTTTLLISPYQDHEKIKAIAEKAADKYSVAFIYEDFRQGFRKSHKASKQMGLYHQNYCGCIYSERERLGKAAKGS